MNWNPKWLLEHGLKPLTPAILTGAVILGCAHAPELQQLPALLSLDAESSVAEETPQPAPSVHHVVAPSPSAEVETLVQGTGNYPDGVYTGSAQGYGGTITVQVTVVDGQITAIEILSAPGETASFFSRAKGVIDRILAAQTWEVDAISGATYSSDGIKAAVENALTGETVPTKTPPSNNGGGNPSALTPVDYTPPEGGYADGTYTGSAQGFGGYITVSVTIAEGKITDISIVSAPGETPSYLASARSVISAMLSAQSPNVDAVSGATYSSTGIINAVKSALSQAAKGTEPSESPSPSPTPVPVPDDAPNYGYLGGTYTGTGEGYGGEITVSVTVSGGQITAIEIVSAPDETPAYLGQALGVIERILARQVPGVDAVAGATFSSEGIMEAVENALSGAIPPSPSPSPDPSPEPSPSQSPAPSESPSPTPNVTVETTTETYTGTATVVPDEDEDFDPYEMALTVTVTVTKTTTVGETETTVVTERTITDAEVTANTDKANLRYLNKAFTKMKDNLIALGSADAVSGATCSSLAIEAAWSKALGGVNLTSVTETISNSQGGAR